jgi:hypothetical protein
MTESALRNCCCNSFYKIQLGCRIDTYPFSVLAEFLKSDNAINLGKQGVISPTTDIGTRVDFRTKLPDNNGSGGDRLATELFDSPPLAYGVASISGATSRFLVSHLELLYLLRVWVNPLNLFAYVCYCQGGIQLPVASGQPIPLSSLFLKNLDFLVFALIGNGGDDFGTLYHWLSYGNRITFGDQQHLIQFDTVTDISLKFFNQHTVPG